MCPGKSIESIGPLRAYNVELCLTNTRASGRRLHVYSHRPPSQSPKGLGKRYHPRDPRVQSYPKQASSLRRIDAAIGRSRCAGMQALHLASAGPGAQRVMLFNSAAGRSIRSIAAAFGRGKTAPVVSSCPSRSRRPLHEERAKTRAAHDHLLARSHIHTTSLSCTSHIPDTHAQASVPGPGATFSHSPTLLLPRPNPITMARGVRHKQLRSNACPKSINQSRLRLLEYRVPSPPPSHAR